MRHTTRIRLATAGEAETVHAIMIAAFEEYRRYALPSSALDETVDEVRRAIEAGGAILAFEGDEPIGSGRFRVIGGVLTFDRLAVVPSHRGRGIGAAMVDWLEAHAVGEGCVAVETTARSQQPDNRPFYTARGYAITGYSGRYGIPDIRTHLRKELVS